MRAGLFRAWPIALAMGLGCREEPAPRRPSVFLISIDTLRADHVGLYGYERETTPFLDRLGSQGIVYERTFTSATWTLVAHMSLLTGLYPQQHGVIRGQDALSLEAPLLAERLAAAGYRTLGFYRPGWVAPRHGFGRGFDVFREHHPVEEAERHLFEELDGLTGERPLFVFLHLFDVHNDPSTKDPPSVFSAPSPFQDLFVEGARERMANETYLSLKNRELTPREREDLTGLYDDGIRHVDAALERVFARLEAEGWLDDSLVIVTADHGEGLSQRENWGHGGPWQEGLRVPLILRLPDGSRAGERVKEITSLVDVVATVMEVAGLSPDERLPGLSLLRPLPPDRVVVGGTPMADFVVRWPEKAVRFQSRLGLLDLASDPGENAPRDLSEAEYSSRLESLALDPRAFYPPAPASELSREELMALQRLGYGEGSDGER